MIFERKKYLDELRRRGNSPWIPPPLLTPCTCALDPFTFELNDTQKHWWICC